MKHPEGRITARTRSDRLLGCSSTSTGAGSAGRNTPTTVREWPEPAQRARLRPDAAQHERNGGLTNHFVRDLSCMISGSCFERSEEHTSELQSLAYLVCRLLLEKKKKNKKKNTYKH